MAREQLMAAGGIVLRREQPPRIAVVRLRKRDEWVLPKGKLDDGETPRDAAKREVLEETGHNVTVHEFLGTLVLDTGTRSKIVHYWRMEASGEQTRPLMDDVRAVDWLPLDDAVERLSRSHEKTFLEAVGPYALAGLIRRTKAKAEEEERAPPSKPMVAKAPGKAAAAAKPPTPRVVAAKPAMTRKRRAPAVEPAELVAAPMPVSAEIEPVEIEAASAGVTPTVSESTTATPTMTPIEDAAPAVVETEASDTEVVADAVEAAADTTIEPPPALADAEMATDDALAAPAAVDAELRQGPLTVPAQHGGTVSKVSDVARVQAVAVEIQSIISEAAARENAAAAASAEATERTDEPDSDISLSDDGPPSVPSEQVMAEAPVHAGEPADQTEPQRRTLAQKVRGWFGSAA